MLLYACHLDCMPHEHLCYGALFVCHARMTRRPCSVRPSWPHCLLLRLRIAACESRMVLLLFFKRRRYVNQQHERESAPLHPAFLISITCRAPAICRHRMASFAATRVARGQPHLTGKRNLTAWSDRLVAPRSHPSDVVTNCSTTDASSRE